MTGVDGYGLTDCSTGRSRITHITMSFLGSYRMAFDICSVVWIRTMCHKRLHKFMAGNDIK